MEDYEKYLTPKEETKPEPEEESLKGKKLTAAFAYLSWLVVIPVIYSSESKFIRYHANQGLVLAIAETAFIALTILVAKISWNFSIHTSLLLESMMYACFIGVFGVCILIGLMNVVLGRTKPLPTFGKYQILK